MSAAIPYGGMGKTDLVRWGACFLVILGLHGAVAAALMMRHDDGDAIDSEPAINFRQEM